MVIVCALALADACLINAGQFCQLMDRRTTVVFLYKLVRHLIDLGDSSHLIQRQAHDTTLLGDGLQNALTNPPDSV